MKTYLLMLMLSIVTALSLSGCGTITSPTVSPNPASTAISSSTESPTPSPTPIPTSTPTHTPSPTSAPLFGGGFIQLDETNAAWSTAMWNNEIQWMKDLGMDSIIISYSVLLDTSKVFYPTSISGLSQVGSQPIAKILTAADSRNMNVHIGLGLSNNWWSQTSVAFLSSLASTNESIASELWSAYGSHSSLKGFYIPEEVDNLTWVDETLRLRLVNSFLAPLSSNIKSLNSALIVSEAPFFNKIYQQPADFETWWTSTLNETPNLDMIMLQDGIGVGNHGDLSDVMNYFTSMKNACDANGKTFWSDTEIFTGSAPAPIARISAQITAEAGLAQKLTCFEFYNYLSPAFSIASLDLFNNYNRLLSSQGPFTNVSDGKTYTVSPAPSGLHPDTGGVFLTNNISGYNSAYAVGWDGAAAPLVTVEVDLGSITSNLSNFRAYLLHEEASYIYIPSSISVKVSDDNTSFTNVGNLSIISNIDNDLDPYQLILNSPVSGRYVKFTFTPGANWMMLTEVSAYTQ